MSVFDKKTCPFCDQKIGIFDKITLSDGYCCKKCFNRKSPVLNVNPRSISLQFFGNHLKERKQNALLLQKFNPTSTYGGKSIVHYDSIMNAFVITDSYAGVSTTQIRAANPDIYYLSDVKDVYSEIVKRQTEIVYSNSNGDIKSFRPKVYAISYDFFFHIVQNHPFAPRIRINLNGGDSVDNDQETFVNLNNDDIISKITDTVNLGRSYHPYHGKTTNENEVKESKKYLRYESQLQALESLFKQNMGKPSQKPQVASVIQSNFSSQQDLLKNAYAKFAICCYIARADGELSQSEKKELDAMFLGIYNKNKNAGVKNELLKIYNTPQMNMFFVEEYLRNADPKELASYLVLAEEIASIDGDFSTPEKQRVYQIRKYLSDVTGVDYTGIHSINDPIDLLCPGCAAKMDLIKYENLLQCPFCGYTKLLS